MSLTMIPNKVHTWTSKSTLHLERKMHYGSLSVMDWPPQSPELKFIEKAWDHLDRGMELKAANILHGILFL